MNTIDRFIRDIGEVQRIQDLMQRIHEALAKMSDEQRQQHGEELQEALAVLEKVAKKILSETTAGAQSVQVSTPT